MEYRTPKLETAKLYETPLLLDVQEITGIEESSAVCLTSGGCVKKADDTPSEA